MKSLCQSRLEWLIKCYLVVLSLGSLCGWRLIAISRFCSCRFAPGFRWANKCQGAAYAPGRDVYYLLITGVVRPSVQTSVTAEVLLSQSGFGWYTSFSGAVARSLLISYLFSQCGPVQVVEISALTSRAANAPPHLVGSPCVDLRIIKTHKSSKALSFFFFQFDLYFSIIMIPPRTSSKKKR